MTRFLPEGSDYPKVGALRLAPSLFGCAAQLKLCLRSIPPLEANISLTRPRGQRAGVVIDHRPPLWRAVQLIDRQIGFDS